MDQADQADPGDQGVHDTSTKYERFGTGGPFDTQQVAASASIWYAEEECLADRLEETYDLQKMGDSFI